MIVPIVTARQAITIRSCHSCHHPLLGYRMHVQWLHSELRWPHSLSSLHRAFRRLFVPCHDAFARQLVQERRTCSEDIILVQCVRLLIHSCQPTNHVPVASALSGAFGGLIAFGILYMDGTAGYSGWRWQAYLPSFPHQQIAILITHVAGSTSSKDSSP